MLGIWSPRIPPCIHALGACIRVGKNGQRVCIPCRRPLVTVIVATSLRRWRSPKDSEERMRASCTCGLPRNWPSVGRRTFYRHHHLNRTARERNSGLRAHYTACGNAVTSAARERLRKRRGPRRTGVRRRRAHLAPSKNGICSQCSAHRKRPADTRCTVARCERTCSRGGVFFPVPHTYGGRSHSNNVLRSPWGFRIKFYSWLFYLPSSRSSSLLFAVIVIIIHTVLALS